MEEKTNKQDGTIRENDHAKALRAPPNRIPWNDEGRVIPINAIFAGKKTGRNLPSTVTISRFGNERRRSMGVLDLDRMMEGGLFEGDLTLVAGNPGSGKTTLGLHFVAAAAELGEPSVFVALDEPADRLRSVAERRGYPIREWEETGLLRLVSMAPEDLIQEVQPGQTALDLIIEEMKARRVVIDSMAQFFLLGQDPRDVARNVQGFLSHHRKRGITTLVTEGIPEIVGSSLQLSRYGLDFLADNVILLRYAELDGALRVLLNVVKTRGTAHNPKFRLVQFSNNGISLSGNLNEFEDLSGGLAHRSSPSWTRGSLLGKS